MTLATIDLSTTWYALGWGTLHFLWQGAIIGLLAFAALRYLRRPDTRYLITCGAMGACLVAFIATVLYLAQSINALPTLATGTALVTVMNQAPEQVLAADQSLSWGDLAAWLWTLGVLVLGVRFGWQWLASHRLRNGLVSPVTPQIKQVFESLKIDMGIAQGVTLLKSGMIHVPMVIGWFRPVILIPATALTSLTPEQLRIILVHELAHIRRHDHLVNMIQGMIEVILFFHPVTWWLSRQVRIEREHCCDDASIRVASNPKSLVEALLKLESLRGAQPTTTLAATGGSLMNRVTRILGISNHQSTHGAGWQALTACTAAAAIVAVATLGSSSPAFAQDRERTVASENAPSFEMSEVLAKITMELGTGELKPSQAAEYLIAAQQILDSEAALHEYTEEIKAAHQANEMTRKEAATKIMAFQQELEAGMMKDARVRIGTAVRDGSMTRQEAGEVFAVYQHLTDSKQEDGKFTRQEIAEARDKMTEMVKSGEITREQMQQRLDRMSKSVAQPEAAAPKLTRADYAKAQADMKKMVEAGSITEEQMNQRLNRMRAMMAQPKAKTDTSNLTRADYAKAQADMKKMVEAGKITEEQMNQRLDRMKAMIAEQAAAKQKAHDEAVAKMTEMVKAGEITEEQMNQRLNRMKAKDTGKSGGTGEARAAFQAMKERLNMAVEMGRMSQEDADAKLLEFGQELRAKMAAEQKSDAGDARANFERMQRRFQMAVESGKMTQEEADQKMGDMRREMRINMAAKQQSADGGMNWDAIKRRVESAVKNGDMTPEQADALYKGLKARMAQAKTGRDEASRDEPTDDCRELGTRLRMAVANGEMTGEEARAIYEEECGGRDR
ncbi:MAG: M48 family metalloprotease [Phycisphaerales bacterium]|nr:M48 family metalloprotease [Phycisphaerales bacterium]